MNELVTLTIIDFDHQGRGIGKINNQVVFIPNALIGEQVRVKITVSKKNYKEGIVVEYITKSPERENPICPYFEKCGGCDIMHMSYKAQLAFKEEKVKNIMKKYGGIEGVLPIIPSLEPLFYRNKVTFQVYQNKIGFYHKKSDHVIEVEKCFLLDEEMNAIFKLVKENLPLHNIRQVIIRHSKKTNDNLVVIDTNSLIDTKALKAFGEKHHLSIHLSGIKKQVVCGNKKMQEQLGEYTFSISPDAFFQVNTQQAETLYNLVKSLANVSGEERVLDLYCGTGTIGLFLSENSKTVMGIEKNENAILDAIENQKNNGIENAEFIASDVDDFMKSLPYQPDVMIVDPPRSGLGIDNAKKIIDLQIEKIIYVSCDPITLARDLQVLKDFYQVEKLIPVDMFPSTYHVECVSLLVRKTLEK